MHQDGSDDREKVEARGLAGAKRGVAIGFRENSCARVHVDISTNGLP